MRDNVPELQNALNSRISGTGKGKPEQAERAGGGGGGAREIETRSGEGIMEEAGDGRV